MAGPLTSPYAPGPDRMNDAFRIADLIRRQGYASAETKGQGMQVVGDLVANTGALLQTGLAHREELKKQQDIANLLASGEDFDPKEIIAKYGMETAAKAYGLYQAMQPKYQSHNPEDDLIDERGRIKIRGTGRASTAGRGPGQWVEDPNDPEKVIYAYPDEIRSLKLQQGPTAGMRSSNIDKRVALSATDEVQKMADEIFTDTGLMSRIQGAKGKIAAAFGNDDLYRTYQDYRKSLAVSVATYMGRGRASDQDVQAALQTIPDPFAGDTIGSNKLKWRLIRIGLGQPMGTAPTGQTGQTGQTVEYTDPKTGTKFDLPPERVADGERNGYVRTGPAPGGAITPPPAVAVIPPPVAPPPVVPQSVGSPFGVVPAAPDLPPPPGRAAVAPPAAATAAVTPPPAQNEPTVEMISPDGKTVLDIPQSLVPQAQAQGARLKPTIPQGANFLQRSPARPVVVPAAPNAGMMAPSHAAPPVVAPVAPQARGAVPNVPLPSLGRPPVAPSRTAVAPPVAPPPVAPAPPAAPPTVADMVRPNPAMQAATAPPVRLLDGRGGVRLVEPRDVPAALARGWDIDPATDPNRPGGPDVTVRFRSGVERKVHPEDVQTALSVGGVIVPGAPAPGPDPNRRPGAAPTTVPRTSPPVRPAVRTPQPGRVRAADGSVWPQLRGDTQAGGDKWEMPDGTVVEPGGGTLRPGPAVRGGNVEAENARIAKANPNATVLMTFPDGQVQSVRLKDLSAALKAKATPARGVSAYKTYPTFKP